VNKGRGWSNELDVGYALGVYFLAERALHSFCRSQAESIVVMAIGKASQPGKGRVMQLAPVVDLPLIERGIVVS